LKTSLQSQSARGVVRIFRCFDACVDFKKLGVRCLSCRHSRCIHSRNVRAAIKSNCMGRLISRLQMTLSRKNDAMHAAETRADTSLLPCKVPIARRRFVLPGSGQLDATRQQAIIIRSQHGLLASIGPNPEPHIPRIGECECPLVERVGPSACFCNKGSCYCVQPKPWIQCQLVSEDVAVKQTTLISTESVLLIIVL
jgi:hypothetical protein